MKPYELLHLLRRRVRTIAAVFLIGIGITCAVILLQSPEYGAESRLLISTSGPSISDLASGSSYTQGIANTYADLASTPYVLSRVIKDLQLRTSPARLSQQISATIPLDSSIITITAESSDPVAAARIANSVALHLKDAVEGLTPREAGVSPVVVTVVQEAVAHTTPVGPSVPFSLVLGIALSLLGALVCAVAREMADTKIYDVEQLSQLSGAPLLGAISNERALVSLSVDAHEAPPWIGEQFRGLRTNLKFAQISVAQSATLMFTSPEPGDGKTTTVANLAISMAQAGARTLAIEADLRAPRLARYLGLDGSIGLTDVLVGAVSLEDAIQVWGDSGLHVLPAGTLPPNPNELLGSDSMRALLATLSSRYNSILLDTPPMLPVSDSAVLAADGMGVVLVAAVGKTGRSHMRASVRSMQLVGASILGVVANRVPPADVSRYGRYDYGAQT